MAGLIDASGISGKLDASNIVMQVLQKGVELSNLQSLCQKVQIPELVGTIPVSAAPSVDEDVLELEHSDIETGAFTNIDFSLKKDRVKLGVSDEATYKSKAGDPLGIQTTAAGLQLANILDKKIIAALRTSPQTSDEASHWDTTTVNPLVALSTAVTSILPYRADFVIMPPALYAHYMATDLVKAAVTTIPAAYNGAIGKVPGLGLDIFVSSHCTANEAIVGSSTGYAAVIGNGPVKVRSWDAEDMGGRMYQIDVFRQVKAPIFLNSSSLNQSCYVLTALHS